MAFALAEQQAKHLRSETSVAKYCDELMAKALADLRECAAAEESSGKDPATSSRSERFRESLHIIRLVSHCRRDDRTLLTCWPLAVGRPEPP
eukprot:TRINITY_DN50492_c0_g1_i1.p3 TRINITY_DN50492_c0_g1~~TRINITY_DN50492_c0_g1_i1.p3  ORF type:complete len:100 (-),score=23.75 TRINITY_DN50492_c0_g1_i1:411-686(-)